MPYEIRIDLEAGKYLKKLPKRVSKRIFQKLLKTKVEPHHFWIRLESRTDFRLRIGDYRAIADISDVDKTIEVMKIGHRSTIYER